MNQVPDIIRRAGEDVAVSKKFVWGAIIIFIIFMAILAIGEIDYSVSNKIVKPDSAWAEFFNLFGEMPSFIAAFAGTIILFGARNREIKWKNILGTVGAIPLLLLTSFQLIYMPVRYIYEHSENSIPVIWWVTIGIISLILFSGAMLLIKKIDKEKFKKLRKIGLVLLLVVISEMILVNVLKIVWARPRMRSIDSIEQFKYWYQINGLSNDNELKSFPSGHTANGFVVIAYVMFFNTAIKLKKNLYLTFAVVWGVLVALSRVVRGDHFLSDVLMSCLLTFLLFLLIQKLVFKKAKKNEQQSK